MNPTLDFAHLKFQRLQLEFSEDDFEAIRTFLLNVDEETFLEMEDEYLKKCGQPGQVVEFKLIEKTQR